MPRGAFNGGVAETAGGWLAGAPRGELRRDLPARMTAMPLSSVAGDLSGNHRTSTA